MKVYKVTVEESGEIRWYNEQGQFHREEGPACEYPSGAKSWYLNGQRLTEEEFNARIKAKDTCDGKIIEMDGKKYKLQAI